MPFLPGSLSLRRGVTVAAPFKWDAKMVAPRLLYDLV